MFEWLEVLSPWWWVAFGIGLGAVEMATMSFFLIWPAVAAVIMAVILWVAPGMQGEVQIAIFAVLAVALTFAGRNYLMKSGGTSKTTLNNRSAQMVGRQAKVTEFELGEGQVEIDGLNWAANWRDGQTAQPGQTVKIIAAAGMSVTDENI